MTLQMVATQLVIYSLLGMSCALGLPLFHYVTAIMIAMIWRHGRGPKGLLTPI